MAQANATGSYAAVVATGSTRRLVIVDRRSGTVTRTLATARAADLQEPFTDVDLAPDGSVWAVVRATSATRYLPYNSSLMHYAGGKAARVLPYVTSVRHSPDGSRLAITVLSPDGNRDGKGTQSLRIATTSGKVLRTLSALSFPVGRDGEPLVEIGAQRVAGWLNPSTLIVGNGCCDEGTVSIVPAGRPSAANRRPTYVGDHATQAVGVVDASTVLLVTDRYSGDGRTTPLEVTGLDAITMTAARPRGRVVASVRDGDPDVNRYVDSFVARARATPLVISPNRFPYKGAGRVVAAYL